MMDWSSLQRFWMFDDPRSYGARAILRWAAEGLRVIGKTVGVAPLDPHDPQQVLRLRDDLLRFQPDAALLANHPAAQLLKQLGLNEPPCRFFVWLLDDPLMMGDAPFGEDEIVLVADPAFASGARQRGARIVRFLPVAAPDRIEAAPRPEFDAKVAYVGSMLRPLEMRAQLPSETADYFDRIAEKKAAAPNRSFDELLAEFPIAPGKRVKRTGAVAYYLYAESNRIARIRHLALLVDAGLRLYGNEGWREEITGTPLETCFRGGLHPLEEYPTLIKSAVVNLNLRSLQGFTAPTHRDFLVPRLGGFLLSTVRHGSGIDPTLDGGDPFYLKTFLWSPEFASPESLREAVLRYIDDKAARREWTARAAEEIAARHLFSHRMEQLLAAVDR